MTGGPDRLAAEFEAHRPHLRGVAFRMLGSLMEAEDAVQEAWLRLSRAGAAGIDNLGGWLTTVVARVCLDTLRARKARREEGFDVEPAPAAAHTASDPEQEAVMADSVGLALMVVLEALTPAERLAFVLHDLFGVPFEEIAPIVGRSPAAARQLASRARRRVQRTPRVPDSEFALQRAVVRTFLHALRAGDIEALLDVLDPDLVVRADAAAAAGAPREVRGARTWAKGAVMFSRALGAVAPALVDGAVGLVLAPRGRLARVLRFTFANGKVASIDVVADPEQLSRIELGVVE